MSEFDTAKCSAPLFNLCLDRFLPAVQENSVVASAVATVATSATAAFVTLKEMAANPGLTAAEFGGAQINYSILGRLFGGQRSAAEGVAAEAGLTETGAKQAGNSAAAEQAAAGRGKAAAAAAKAAQAGRQSADTNTVGGARALTPTIDAIDTEIADAAALVGAADKKLGGSDRKHSVAVAVTAAAATAVTAAAANPGFLNLLIQRLAPLAPFMPFGVGAALPAFIEGLKQAEATPTRPMA